MDGRQFRVVIVDVEGMAREVVWEVGGDGVLRHLQEAVGGTVDVVALRESLDMWCNDNGLLEGLAVNVVATRMARAFGLSSQAYVGTVVFTGGADVEGETLPLRDDAAAVVLRLAEMARAG